MSETSASETDATPAVEPTVEETTPVRLPDGHPLVKAAAARKTENNELRAKLKEFEDAQLSETERLTSNLTSETERADTAEAELGRLRAAIKHGLADEDLDLLGTGTPDELDARAKRIADLRSDQATAAQRRPIEGLGTTTSTSDPDAWLRGLAGA